MGIFGAKKRNEVFDLSRDYHQTHRTPKVSKDLDLTKKEEAPVEAQTSSFPFFFGGANNSTTETTDSSIEVSEDSSDEKRKKLAKRLVDMTNRIEDLDNKLYHLQQRIEVLEKKDTTSNYESNGLGF